MYISIIYFLIGFIFMFIWWEIDYKYEYEYHKLTKGVDDPIIVIYLLCLVCFWPIKLIKNLITNKSIF